MNREEGWKMTPEEITAFQRDLAKKAQQDEEDDDAWRAARWAAARKDMANGTFKRPEIRIPIVLNPNGPISTPEQLQRLVGMESLPEVLETTLTTWDWSRGEEVSTVNARICHVDLGEKARLKKRAEVEYTTTGKYMVMFHGQERYPILVRSLKEGGAAGDKRTAYNGDGMGNRNVTK